MLATTPQKLIPGVIVPIKVPSIVQIDLFKIIYIL